MTGIAASRALLAVAGACAAAYGGWLLWDQGPDNLRAALVWLVAGVAAHDAVVAPTTIALGLLAGATIPPAWRASAAAGFVVLATLTVAAIPVLGRFGEREDNPTLLDRDYALGWLAVATLTLSGSLLLGIWQRARDRSED